MTIQSALAVKESFASIAKTLGKHPSTISSEVRKRAITKKSGGAGAVSLSYLCYGRGKRTWDSSKWIPGVERGVTTKPSMSI